MRDIGRLRRAARAVSHRNGEVGKQSPLLADLSIPMTDGTRRAAQPADVTHIRWAFQNPIPVGGTGKLMFRGVVK